MRRLNLNRQSMGIAIALIVILVGIQPSVALGQASTQIVNGSPDLAEPTTAALIQGDSDSGHVVCSVTLIGCDSAITTAHCFNQNSSQKTLIFFQHAGFVEIESVTKHPAYVAAFPPNTPNFDALRVEDISFIKLVQPVSGVTPSSIIQLAPPALGTPGKIVGFGRDPITAVSPAGVDDNAGIKRSGTMTIEACADSLVGEDVLCWHPPDPPELLGPAGEDVSTCDGDSGGPLFVDEAGIRVVAGITKGAVYISGGQSDLCEPPVDPFETNVARHRDWIQGSNGQGGMVAVTGAIPTFQKECGQLEQLPENVKSGDNLGDCDPTPWSDSPTPRTCGFTGFLDADGTNTALHNFPVPAGTTLLRVAFNGISSPSSSVDANYYLRASAPATANQFDCAAAGPGTVGFCEITDPVADTWHTLVDQTLYQGEYQVTVTLFGPPPPAEVPSLDSNMRMLLIGAMIILFLLALAKRSMIRLRTGSGLRPH